MENITQDNITQDPAHCDRTHGEKPKAVSHGRRESEFTRHRDAAFSDMVRSMLRRLPAGKADVRQLVKAMTKCAAPRFWVSEERALRVIRKALRTGCLPEMVAGRRAMYTDLLAAVRRLLASRPGVRLSEAVFEAVNSPAPSYYYSPEYTRTLVYRLLSAAQLR